MKHIIYCAIIICCIIFKKSIAQSKLKSQPVFTLKSAPNEVKPDSISVVFNKGILGSTSSDPQFRVIVKVKKKSDGSFNFTIPSQQPISPIWMIVWYPGGDGRLTSTYYAEQNDRINIVVKKYTDTTAKYYGNSSSVVKLTFYGKGAAKYNIYDKLGQVSKDFSTSYMRRYFSTFTAESKKTKLLSPIYAKSQEFQEYLNRLFLDCKADYKRNLDTIMRYDGVLGPTMVSFYKLESNSFTNSFCRHISGLYSTGGPETRQVLENFYFTKVTSLADSDFTSPWIKYAFAFKARLSQQIMLELNFKTHGYKFPFSFQYNVYKQIQNIDLKEILITRFFVEDYLSVYVNDTESRDSCLKNAIQVVKNKELQPILINELRFAKGSAMADFSFADTTGKSIGLGDFRGKVFMLDFYFNGCSSCIAFNDRLKKEVYPNYVDNPDFKIVSVNIDKKKTVWLEAIKSGLYSEPNSINLNTGGYDHPLFKQYGITSFPWVVLVDRSGKVLSYKLNVLDSATINNLIQKALSFND
jgi:thiol-disulfide isomerase/thioredoxin